MLSPTFTNNSDEPHTPDRDDYVSFPMFPEPQDDRETSFGRILSRTLRKVTSNASHLVQKYANKSDDDEDENAGPVRLPNLASTILGAEDIDSVPHIYASGPAVSRVDSVQTSIEEPHTKESNQPRPRTEFPDKPTDPPPLVAPLPVVMSDRHSLRLSTMSVPKLSAVDTSSARSAREVSATASLLPASQPVVAKSTASVIAETTANNSHDSHIETSSLQHKITSIFTNLPNDIEVSDDSASEGDTNDSTLGPLKRSDTSFDKDSYFYTSSRRNSIVPSISSKTQSSALLSGAKSILSTSIPLTVLPASLTPSNSIKRSKKKKKLIKRKNSENPLKNGGIPQKYWMNDSFVSDCLNCFKPFTAFRRKHHCRFCGQIFCADCTLFISYNQHKDERKARLASSTHRRGKSYHDQLRVCKPCYSDVIVYLSDDSSSSSSESDEENAVPAGSLTPNYLLSRMRSLSTGSRKDSLRHEGLDNRELRESPQHNKTFLKSPDQSSPVSYRSPQRLTLTEITATRPPHFEVLLSKHAPQMAIPTTRKGEAVEIPDIPSRRNTNKAMGLSTSASSKFSPFTSLDHSSRHLLSLSDFSPWIKNYMHLKDTSAGDLSQSLSLDNIGQFYSSLIGKRSNGKLTDKDTLRYDRSEITNSEKIHEEDFESESEDENVMSIYTSLNHGPLTARSSHPPRHSISAAAVPTLGEFPRMLAKDSDKSFSISQGHSNHMLVPLGGLQPRLLSFMTPKPETSSKSRERAHASLLRMKSRRRGASTRNVLILTRNNNRLPSLDASQQTYDSPPVSPAPDETKASLSKTFFEEITDSVKSLSPETFPRDYAEVLNRSQSFDEKEVVDKSARYLAKDVMYSSLFKKLAYQCFQDTGIKEDTDRWYPSLMRALSHLGDLKLTDTLDIKQYVKIKKIFGGQIEDTVMVDGIFMTKNVDSKRMAVDIDNPKIAILMFPLEYMKQKEQFISLRTIHSQQSVYISNLVSRIVSLKPDIILVGDTVCGMAESLLEAENITVISNLKPQIIERVSRYTKADIFQSINDLFFKKGSLGACAKFKVKRYVYENRVKTFVFFTGTDVTSGFTIALRGGPESLLDSVKYTTEVLAPSILNSKFEISLLKEQGVEYLDEPSSELSLLSKVTNIEAILNGLLKLYEELPKELQSQLGAVHILDKQEVFEYCKSFQERQLSSSPSVVYAPPSALVNLIESYEHYLNAFDSFKQTLLSGEDIDPESLKSIGVSVLLEMLPGGSSDLLSIVKSARDVTLRYSLDELVTKERIWSNCAKLPKYLLSPSSHRSIHILNSTVSITHATPCFGPNLVVVDYYTENDKCIGLFLDQIFQEASKTCEECGVLFLNHYKSYVHGNGKLDFITERFENVMDGALHEGLNQRFMWSYCQECKKTTPIQKMSPETYYYSIGKFFELGFWNGKASHIGSIDCPHDFFRSHIRYFGLNDLVIRLEYSNIETYEVIAPRKQLEIVPSADMALKIKTYHLIRDKSNKFFKSIESRLYRVKVDTFEDSKAGMEKLEELKNRHLEQVGSIGSQLLELYNSTPPTLHLPLNAILRTLQELGVFWDNEFNDFEKRFLPSENDITKITQFHLTNFLMEKLNSEQSADSQRSENKDDTRARPLDVPSAVSEGRAAQLNKEKTNEIGEMIPSSLFRRLKLGKLDDKVQSQMSQVEDTTRKGSIDVPEGSSTPRDETHQGQETAQPTQSRVSQLANYFDQMNLDQISKEFKQQRERELKKKINKFKAFPIVASKPIVEIYDNIEDVVDVTDMDTEKGDRAEKPEQKWKDVPRKENTKTEEAIDKPKEKPKDVKKGVELPQPEKNSLLKSLTTFWADRSASLWDSLDFPLDAIEHTFADSDVIVREDEPSSLVSFCLSSSDYKLKIKVMESDGDMVDNNENGSSDISENKKLKNFVKIEKKFKKKLSDDESVHELEKIMTKDKSNHLKYQFSDGDTQFSCKIFYSEQFEALRRSCGNNDSFIQSLSRCVKWDSSGGQSGSNFLKTLDNRYIVKELSKSELESFIAIAPFYFKYIGQSLFSTLSTAIAKIFGFYQIHIKNAATGKTFRMDFLIMENLFYNHKTTRIFDLKGSMRNRHVKQTGKENEVLLDENMIEYIYESPLFVKEHLKRMLRGSLFNDTSFFSAMDVMDYSLIIGIDDTSKRLYIGIIDWLRTFTWDKKVENWVKGNNLMGGGKKGKDPTIVTPKQYRTRFREAMERYILEVPDIWYEGR